MFTQEQSVPCSERLSFADGMPIYELFVKFSQTSREKKCPFTLCSALLVEENGSVTPTELPTSVLLNKFTGDVQDVERVSTGTKHALHEWLEVTRN